LFNISLNLNNYIDSDFTKISDLYRTNNIFLTISYFMIKNTLNYFIANSLSVISYITNKTSLYIYESNGKLTIVFLIIKKFQHVFYHYLSNILIYTNNSYENCNNLNSNNAIYFNKSLNTCLIQIREKCFKFYKYIIFLIIKLILNMTTNFGLLNQVDFNKLTSEIINFYEVSF
jgi:hypothetical protein